MTSPEHGRASRHEDSGLMSDEDFYDAHEDSDAGGSRQGSAASNVPAYYVSPIHEMAHKWTDSDDSKYIVKNKDTGEVFDIRDLASMPANSYSIFPNDFLAPQEEDVKRTKSRRPSLTKIMSKFPMKSKVKEPLKRNHVPVTSFKKEKREFEDISLAQTISKHIGTIWTIKFSHDGARLVSGGQDAVLRVWRVQISSDEDAKLAKESDEKQILDTEPERSYQGHTMPIVDVSWSRSNFILSASMDKTIRLWHISREDCLHVFHHPDSVPAVDFHPKEDRYFLSGCFDNKARVWDIPDGCVVSYVQTPVMITAASFNPSGTRAVVGLLNGQCIFYQVNSHQQMNYYTQIECRNSRGSMRKGRKVTGIEFDPEGKYFLVSTNDSRMRLFSVDNYSRICKYKGLVNGHLQIKGRFSQDGDFVICGSENGSVYVWNKARYLRSMSIVKSSKHDRNSSYESFSAADPPNGIVTVALFAPASTFAMVKSKLEARDDVNSNACTGLIVSASYDGCIKFFERSFKSV
ncbi:WD40 repeat-containing protein [Plasmopara halstedii]|uniref:WD40 repeat-containing protein n=1 Tax=Plasmopara halstedii TaxID=4781 RepID=A0A0P1AXM7_PLAHL|nr:WD40 repeat-containing protein [Plasmopara halstedii]CEG46423.1 WD40 repeat-containing protein [Plasmopara halstedii]|eukprot:XP_024582792.1 WD40 repeat-containing protein [Plasmopara halstedii]